MVFCFIQNAYSQITGNITGSNEQPIPFVNVILLNSTDTSLVTGTLTNEMGHFLIENIKPGSYILRLSSVGYSTWNSPTFLISDAQAEKYFGTQIMVEDSKQLEEIIISGEKPLYQQESGGMVVNVESSVLTKGSSALQVLERSPGVYIDRQNNTIALNGKNDVMIMVNGKLMRLPVNQVVNMLNGMNADDIEKIELLTTPSAKYDAQGNAGMINIVLKKNEDLGMTGSLSLSGGYGVKEKGSGSFNFSHNSEKINLYGSYSYFHDRSYYEWFVKGSSNRPAFGGEIEGNFINNTRPTVNNHTAIVGFDLDLKSIKLGSNINYNNSLRSVDTYNQGEYINPGSYLLMKSNVSLENHWKSFVTNFYIEKIISKGEKINLDVDYLNYINTNPSQIYSSFFNSEEHEIVPEGELFSNRHRGTSNSPFKVGILKIDYFKTWNEKLNFEGGIKGTYTTSSSFSKIENLSNDEWTSSSRTSGESEMKETIGAIYATFHFQLNPSANIVGGARFEYSDIEIFSKKEEDRADRNMRKLFPNLIFTKKLDDHSDFQFSYSKRISRPSYTDLASFMIYVDPMSVFTGNPLLRPTVTNNLKVGYNTQGFSASLLLSRDDFPIARYQLTEATSRDLMLVSPQNLEYQNNLTFQGNFPWKVNNWWSMNYGLVGGWRQFKLLHTKEKLEKAYFGYSLNGNQTFTLPKSFFLELSGWYSGPQYDGSKKVDGFGMLDLGIKKDLKHNNGSIQVSITDVFQSMNIHSYFGNLTEEAFSEKNHIIYNPESRKSRIIKLTYSKSFGTGKSKGPKQRGMGSKDERDRIRTN